MAWWSHHFNRPLKDPLLLSYTLEELAYEYFNVMERKKADEERAKAETDKIEEVKQQAAEDWADQMEAEEEAEVEVDAVQDPAQDPANIAWMEQVLQENKQQFGDTFGEDLSLNF